MKDTESATEREPESEPRVSAEKATEPLLETVEMSTGSEPDAAIIWLHGLGADGHDFEPIVPYLTWPDAPSIRYIFPHAPVRPVTLNGGMEMRAWYDILNIDSDRGHDLPGIEQSVRQITDLVDRELRRGIPPNRIVLAGFSQGGAIAIQLAVRYPQRLAGLIALSTYMLNADRLRSQAHPLNSSLPVFMGHGSMDPVVPMHMGEEAARVLREMGHPLEWQGYAMTHSVSPEEISHIRVWLSQQLNRTNA